MSRSGNVAWHMRQIEYDRSHPSHNSARNIAWHQRQIAFDRKMRSSSVKSYRKNHPGYRDKYDWKVEGVQINSNGVRTVFIVPKKKRRNKRIRA